MTSQMGKNHDVIFTIYTCDSGCINQLIFKMNSVKKIFIGTAVVSVAAICVVGVTKNIRKMLEVSEPVVETLAANSMKRQEANKVAAKPVESQKNLMRKDSLKIFKKVIQKNLTTTYQSSHSLSYWKGIKKFWRKLLSL